MIEPNWYHCCSASLQLSYAFDVFRIENLPFLNLIVEARIGVNRHGDTAIDGFCDEILRVVCIDCVTSDVR